jgi:hypothetical protein
MNSSAQTVPLSVALVAGALVALNPLQRAAGVRLPHLLPRRVEHPDRTATVFSLFNADQGVPQLVLLISPT